jgi:hypothetical protein
VAAQPAADAAVEAVGEAWGVLVQSLDQLQEVSLGDAAGGRSHSAPAFAHKRNSGTGPPFGVDAIFCRTSI